MANGKLEIPGLDEATEKVVVFKKEFSSLIDELSKGIKVINETSEASKKQAQTYSSVAQSSKEQEQAELKSTETKQKATKAQKDLTEAEINEARVRKQNNELLKASATLNDAEAGNIEKMKAKLVILRLEKEKLTGSGKEYEKQVKKIVKEQNKLASDLEKTNYKTQKAFWSFGQLKNSLSEVPGPIGMITSSFKTLFATPIGLIMTGITLTVTGLVNIFKSFDPVVEAVERKLAALGATFSVVKDIVVSVFTGQKSLKEAVKGAGDAMEKAMKQAEDYKRAEQDLEKQTIMTIESQAKYKRQIDQLLLQSKDRTKSEKERIDLLNQAEAIEKKAYEERAAIAEAEFKISQDKILASHAFTQAQIDDIKKRGAAALFDLQNTYTITDAEIEAYANASAKREQVLNDSVVIEEKIQNKRNALLDKQDEERNKRLQKEKEEKEKRAKEDLAFEQEKAKTLQEWEQEWFELSKELDLENDKTMSNALMEQNQEAFNNKINSLNEQYQNELALAGSNQELIEAATQAHNQRLLQNELDYWASRMLLFDSKSKEFQEAQTKVNDIYTQMSINTARKKIESDEQRLRREEEISLRSRELMIGLAEGMGEITSLMASGQRDAAKEALKSIVKMALNQLKAIAYVQLGIAEVLSLTTPDSILTFGISGLARAAVLAALITGATTAAEIGANTLIDQFAKGTKDAPGGKAIVGELGSELIKTPDGSMYLTPPKATLIDLPKHSEVTPNHLVERELMEISKMENIQDKSDNIAMLKALYEIRDKPTSQTTITNSGIYTISKKGSSITHWLNTTYRNKC